MDERVKWEEQEYAYVANNCHRMTDGQIAASLSRVTGKPFTAAGVRRVRRDRGLAKSPGKGTTLLGG